MGKGIADGGNSPCKGLRISSENDLLRKQLRVRLKHKVVGERPEGQPCGLRVCAPSQGTGEPQKRHEKWRRRDKSEDSAPAPQSATWRMNVVKPQNHGWVFSEGAGLAPTSEAGREGVQVSCGLHSLPALRGRPGP